MKDAFDGESMPFNEECFPSIPLLVLDAILGPQRSRVLGVKATPKVRGQGLGGHFRCEKVKGSWVWLIVTMETNDNAHLCLVVAI